jgi:hypothetical protein
MATRWDRSKESGVTGFRWRDGQAARHTAPTRARSWRRTPTGAFCIHLNSEKAIGGKSKRMLTEWTEFAANGTKCFFRLTCSLLMLFYGVKCTPSTQTIDLLLSSYSNYQNDYVDTWTIADADQRSKTCHVRDIFFQKEPYMFFPSRKQLLPDSCLWEGENRYGFFWKKCPWRGMF